MKNKTAEVLLLDVLNKAAFFTSDSEKTDLILKAMTEYAQQESKEWDKWKDKHGWALGVGGFYWKHGQKGVTHAQLYQQFIEQLNKG